MEPMGWQTYMNDSSDTKTKEELDDWKKFYRTIRFESGDIILMHDTAFMLSYLDGFLTKLDQMNVSYVDPHNIGSQFFPEGYWR
ncbi:TonB-dependent receptor [Novimethylophilus kurashikiensis]|uniref:TonB-dependent receptor n=1 Tax=Novimethylophilus kurashikiensis TaxID=1825523 RepID=A0A2R5FA34_9PROT|nr:TonB-dependent receptor [Novimethylophilus kurashikiensis]